MTSLQMPDRNLKTERRKLMRSLRMPDRNWRTKKLINETEYQVIQKRLMKDYGIVSNITA